MSHERLCGSSGVDAETKDSFGALEGLCKITIEGPGLLTLGMQHYTHG